MKRVAVATLAVLAACGYAQVSERVVRELISMPQPEPYEWQYLVLQLRSLGEDDLALLVLDANSGVTSGSLYRWYRKDRDLDKMTREIQVSFNKPEALPQVIEEALYFGGKPKADQAYECIRQHGLVSSRANLKFLSEERRDASPEFKTYFLLASEGKAEDANRFLPLIKIEELKANHAPISTALYFGDTALVKAMWEHHPEATSLSFLLAVAYARADDELKSIALRELLFGEPSGAREVGQLALELFQSGRRATATRLMNRHWGGFAQSLTGDFPMVMPTQLLVALHENGFDEKLMELARALEAKAKSQLSAGEPLVQDLDTSPAELFRLAVRISVCTYDRVEADRLVEEFDALYERRERSMGLIDESLLGVKLETLIEIGEYDVATEDAISKGRNSYRSRIPNSIVESMMKKGDHDGARQYLRGFLARMLLPESRAFAPHGFFIASSLVGPMRDLGMRDELRSLLAEAYGTPEDAATRWYAWEASQGFVAAGDLSTARAFAAVASTIHLGEDGLQASVIGSWMSPSDHKLREIGRRLAKQHILETTDRQIAGGVFVGRSARSLMEGLVAALAYVQSDSALAETTIECIARLSRSLKPEVRSSIEYRALIAAIGREARPNPYYQPPPRLSVELQDRVLRAVVGSGALRRTQDFQTVPEPARHLPVPLPLRFLS